MRDPRHPDRDGRPESATSCGFWRTGSSRAGTHQLHLPEGEGGIADALRVAKHFADGQKSAYSGAQHHRGQHPERGGAVTAQAEGAHILLKEVQDAERFGVAELAGGKIVGIEEKPQRPKSNYAVTGFYMYDPTVFDKIRTLGCPRTAANSRLPT